MYRLELPIMVRRSVVRSINEHEIQHFDANRGVRAWKRVPTLHSPGKYRPFNFDLPRPLNSFGCARASIYHCNASKCYHFIVIIVFHCHYSYGILTSSSDYRSNVAPSDSDRDCPSRRDSDPPNHHPPANVHSTQHQPTRLSITAPSADSESGDNSPTPSPRALRRRTKIRNHSLTSLCLLSHHPFFSTFRETLFILKKLIGACNESSSPKSVGASRQSGR